MSDLFWGERTLQEEGPSTSFKFPRVLWVPGFIKYVFFHKRHLLGRGFCLTIADGAFSEKVVMWNWRYASHVILEKSCCFRIDFQLQNVCFKDFAFLPLPGEMIQFD